MSDLRKLDTLLYKKHLKVLRYQGKIAHQMWRDHPFSQRNMATERTFGVVVGGDRKGGEGMWTKLEKKGGRQ